MLECLIGKRLKDSAYRRITQKKNSKNASFFNAIAYSDRIIFVPQCMRNIQKCKAKEVGGYYLCAQCGGCKINDISKKSKELGYKALYILKGGRIVEKLIDELKPKAIVGVACFYEGSEGMKICERKKVCVQFVPLTRDGCVDTDVNIDTVFEII